MMPLKHVARTVSAIVCLCALSGQVYAAQIGKYVYSIQIASFQKHQLAVNTVEKLKKNSLNAFYQSQEIPGKGVWNRIYIGRYATVAEARMAAERMQRRKIISDYYIRRVSIVERKIAGKDIEREGNAGLVIRNITFGVADKKNNCVYIHGDRYFWPSLRCSIHNAEPTLIVSIDNVDKLQKDVSTLAVNGALIEEIGIRFNRDTDILTMKVALAGSDTYTISQFFDKEENIFRFEVEAGMLSPDKGERVTDPEKGSRDR